MFITTKHSRVLMTLRKEAFENIVGKGENAGCRQFLSFHNVFFPVKDRNHL